MSRWGDCYGGFTCLFSLYRMAGEYPNFVSLCEYLHVLVVLGYLFRSLGSSDSMAQRIDWNPRECDGDEVKNRKGEGSGFGERQWPENNAGIAKKAVRSSQHQRSGSGLQVMLAGSSSPEPRRRGHPPSHTSADIQTQTTCKKDWIFGVTCR